MSDQYPLTDDFPFESRFIEIKGHKMHYIDEGKGGPLLFLHGNPTSAYLWRNIITYMRDRARCVALDLIGFGLSERPDIDYRLVSHCAYVQEFIDRLQLRNLTPVLHDWGAVIGFHYGLHHLDNIKGIAFMEAGNVLRPLESIDEFHAARVRQLFSKLHDPAVGAEIMKRDNPFLENMKSNCLRCSPERELSDVAWERHKAPFRDPESRKPMWMFPTQFPIGGVPKDAFEIVAGYSPILQSCTTPKLMFYAHPGWSTPPEVVAWIKSHIKNLKTLDLGNGYHWCPEDNPVFIREELGKWYASLGDADS